MSGCGAWYSISTCRFVFLTLFKEKNLKTPRARSGQNRRWLLSRRTFVKGSVAASGALVWGCGDSSTPMPGLDAAPHAAPVPTPPVPGIDAGAPEAGAPDAGAPDSAGAAPDAGAPDSAAPDADPTQPPPAENHPPAWDGPAWLRDARIGGADGALDPPEMGAALDALAAQGVSVVELDSLLSYYLSDAEFEAEAQRLDAVARDCHTRGMKAVIYFPTLEVLTPNAATAPGSMLRDHPDWVQMDMLGKPNTFVGGEGRVFWVEPGTESTWLCPSSPYAAYFIARVQRLARTALDGLWGDVPLLSDIVADWPCTCTYCRARFAAETGQVLPSAVDWSNPVFRRWVTWRHHIIWDFEQNIVAAAKQARADFEVIIETVSMDYSSATVQGLDAASHDDGRVLRVWEVDAVSDRTAMRSASADDWMDMAIMMKHGAGCSAPRPSWVFCYGAQPDDAEHVFGLALATGNNPFELKIPEMSQTVAPAYRSRVFSWLKGEDALYAAYPFHKVAVLFSSASRDFLDRNAGVGLFSSLNPSDDLWWSTTASDTVSQLQYLADYRGWCRALIHAHVPYDVLPAPRLSAQALARYPVLVVPSAVALSDAGIALLAAYVQNGGTLIASGPDLGQYDEDGRDRGTPAMLTALGVSPTGNWGRKSSGKGLVAHGAERAGRLYLRRESQRAAMEIAESISRAPQIVTNAPAGVVMSVRRTRDGKLLLVAANLDNLGSAPQVFTPRPATFNVALALEGRKATAVVASQPGAGKAPVAFEVREGRVHFALGLAAVGIVTVTLS